MLLFSTGDGAGGHCAEGGVTCVCVCVQEYGVQECHAAILHR